MASTRQNSVPSVIKSLNECISDIKKFKTRLLETDYWKKVIYIKKFHAGAHEEATEDEERQLFLEEADHLTDTALR